MKVLIRRIPPTSNLEGIDLRPYGFAVGQVYEVDARLGGVLIEWGYAERATQKSEPHEAADRPRRPRR